MQDGADLEFDGTERDRFGRHVEFFQGKEGKMGCILNSMGRKEIVLGGMLNSFRGTNARWAAS